ncbi:uncharacterized protein MYCGRDRAFT_79213 [Zymoseptoria tritici IPO323]|uniref:Uncharacterized protein n=1 Tax=Zymoseptoria tritici (strain CBS 115943 / IPO323) TaxID=336722 RepID=F9X3E4_ZYMTI|nr:uncharacterized protein MYCGRDRAFT_79213 [Zymoseptoria tritici IPO323]EGP90732.1 hypothetical protein MYCGRDRAFT_79213 [Zymoseptoria tritici IPO323]
MDIEYGFFSAMALSKAESAQGACGHLKCHLHRPLARCQPRGQNASEARVAIGSSNA